MTRPTLKPLAAAIFLASLYGNAVADTFEAADEAGLRDAIHQVNSLPGTHFIVLTNNITLTDALPPVLNNVTVQGNNFTLTGSGDQRLLLIGAGQEGSGPRILVHLNNLTLGQGVAAGGDGADGGGGGMGAGGAVFVNARADVVLNNVDLVNNRAVGGAGAVGSGGGGGGLDGDGGQASAGFAGGGGGLASGGSGGGGLGDGGQPGADGVDGTDAPYWHSGDAGDGSGVGAGAGGQQGGGGGGAGAGGAGGGGGLGGTSATGEHGGAGGLFGGGGGASGSGDGGAGGFAGGGGGSITGTAGAGGFGGGGGSGAVGGAGGFGGGGGSGAVAGSGGIGGGDGAAGGGGGGAGLGGAIFVAEGGGLTLAGSTRLNGNGVGAGAGAGGGQQGVEAGSGLFLQGSGTLQIRGPAGNQVMTINDDITDAVGSGLAGAADYDRWNLYVTGNSRDGQVHLLGENSYSGDTYITGTTLVVQRDENLGGLDGSVIMDGGGLGMGNGFTLTRDLYVNSGGGHIFVNFGASAELASNVSGDGDMTKVGLGDLALLGGSAFSGNWRVEEGTLVLDRDDRLGTSAGSLTMGGGGLRFTDDVSDFRGFFLSGETIVDNGGYDVVFSGAITGSGTIRYQGNGLTRLDANQAYSGISTLAAGTVSGGLGLSTINIFSGATWDLGGTHRTGFDIGGDGTINLGANNVTAFIRPQDDGIPPVVFAGNIIGSGGVIKEGSGVWDLTGSSSYSGGTWVNGGVLGVSSDASVGHGPVTLGNGRFDYLQDITSLLDFTIAGANGYIGTRGTNVVLQGQITGNGNLVKEGDGLLILDADNSYTGDTIVRGFNSRLAWTDREALGNGVLRLDDLGGIRLLANDADLFTIHLGLGGGVIDTNGFDAASSNQIIGPTVLGFPFITTLVKEGEGELALLADQSFVGELSVAGGTLRLGDGGLTGSLASAVYLNTDTGLIVDRDGVMTHAAGINGVGWVRKTGAGVLHFTGMDNSFYGGLFVDQGFVRFSSAGQLGLGPVELNGGGLWFDADLYNNVHTTSAGGEFRVQAGTHLYGGTSTADGEWVKSGDGTLVIAGLGLHQSGSRVMAGTLQVGDGLSGMLYGNVAVDAGARLVFARDDLTSFGGQISGAGDVRKEGPGELVFSADHLYTGSTSILAGGIRLGFGGTSGSLAGDVFIDQDAWLHFDRSDNVLVGYDTTGDGTVIKSGAGALVVTGDFDHAGGTTIFSGALQVGNGATLGTLAGDVDVAGAALLRFNRSDDVSFAGDLSGLGQLVQSGSGELQLSGDNTHEGGTRVESGWLAIDADQRLGSGELVLNGGGLRWLTAFDDLRDVRVGSSGGRLDVGNEDVLFQSLISGSGLLVKDGAGELRISGLLSLPGLDVNEGTVIVGDGNVSGLLFADASVSAGASLGFDRADDILVDRALAGAGQLVQQGTGLLRLTGDRTGFSGTTLVRSGTLRLDGVHGGDVQVQAGELQLAGTITGNLHLFAGSTLRSPVMPVGNMVVQGDAQFDADSLWIVRALPDGSHDALRVDGGVDLAGDLFVMAGSGTFANSTRYSVIEHGSRTGSFNQVDTDLAFLTPTLVYEADTVDLVLRRNDVAFATKALTDNQEAVANALDRISAADPLHPVVQHVEGLTEDGARTAYTTLSGDSLVTGQALSGQVSALFSRQLSLRTSRLGAASRGPAVSENLVGNLFADDVPQFINVMSAQPGSPVRPLESGWLQLQRLSLGESKDSGIGNADWRADGTLVMAGLDGYWRTDLTVGGSLGYAAADTRFSDRSASGDIAATLAGLYLRWDREALHFKLDVSGSSSRYRHSRTVPLAATPARASFDVQNTAARAEVGYGKHMGSLGVRPFFSLNALSQKQEAYRETGGGSAALEVAAMTRQGGEFGVGVEVSRPLLLARERWAQLQAGVGLSQPWGDTAPVQRAWFTGTTESFSVSAARHDGVILDYGLGASFHASAGSAFWVGYQGRASDLLSEGHALLGMQVRW